MATIDKKQKRWYSKSTFDSLDKTEIPIGTEIQVAGELGQADFDTDTNTKLNNVANKLDKAGGTITGSLTISQNLIVNGTTSTVESTSLKVADKLIYVAKDNSVALTTPAGIITPKYDGTNSGGIVYDSTGTAYVGDITLDSNGNVDVTNSDLQPIATRDDNGNLTNGNLISWDAANNKLVDSGNKTSDFLKTTGGTVTGDIHSTGDIYSTREIYGREFISTEGFRMKGSYQDKSTVLATALVSSIQSSTDRSYFTMVVDDTSNLYTNQIVAFFDPDSGLLYAGFQTSRIASIDTATKTIRFNIEDIDAETFDGFTRIGLYSSNADNTYYEYNYISNDNTVLKFPNAKGTIALTPNTAPTEDSVVITSTDRTTTWKPISEFANMILIDTSLLGG